MKILSYTHSWVEMGI